MKILVTGATEYAGFHAAIAFLFYDCFNYAMKYDRFSWCFPDRRAF